MEYKETICIGMMSGTSMDGIDACLLSISDNLKINIIDSCSVEYPEDLKRKLLNAANNKGSVSDVCFLNFIVGEYFADCADKLISKNKSYAKKVEFIATHGQTIFHIPENITLGNVTTKSTLQIGDISVIAERTGIKTIGDFRTKDIAAGGLGAPLVPFADEIIFGKDKNRAVQNIGGISNVTVLSKDNDTFAFDNGPGNMLIDYYAKNFFQKDFDKDGQLASQGTVDFKWLNILLKEKYYSQKPPKTTGRELFNEEYAENILNSAPKNHHDIMATITQLTASVIYESYKDFVFPMTSIDEVIIGGGGAYNKTLMKMLQEKFDKIPVKRHEDYGIPDKLKEAVAFALLGYYTLHNMPNNVPSCTGAKKKTVLGKIAY